MPTQFRFLLLLSSFLAIPLADAEPQTLTLHPAVVQARGSGGQGLTRDLTLENRTNVDLDFVLEAQDVVVREGQRHFLDAGTEPGGIAQSAVFSPARLHIPAHGSGVATVTLTLPHATAQRAMVVRFRSATPVRASGRTAFLSLGALFTFTLSDHVAVTSGALQYTPASAIANAQFAVPVYNSGEEPVEPAGLAVLLDSNQQISAKIPFRSQRLLPGESARLVADYPGDLPAGRYRAVATLDISGQARTVTTTVEVP